MILKKYPIPQFAKMSPSNQKSIHPQIIFTLHEQTCFNQPYKCKYSSYGYTFQHGKQNLQLHYRGGGFVKGMTKGSGSSGNSSSNSNGVDGGDSGDSGGEDHIPGCMYAKFYPIINTRTTSTKYQISTLT